ncbi:MAG: radical SAM protein [Candidatus Helarchaeota archaeon]
MREISIEITHECPLNCIYCSSEANIISPIDNEINEQEIIQVLKDAKKLKCEFFSISGGEPLQKERLLRNIMLAAKELNYNILLYTCGIKKKKVMEEIKGNLVKFFSEFNSKQLKIIFNLQGHNQSLVEQINNTPGSFKLIEKSITNCVNAGIYCEAHFVPIKLNFDYIEDIINYAKNLGIKKISFLRFVQQGRAKNKNYLNLSINQFFDLQKKLNIYLDRKDIEIRLGHPINFLFTIDSKREIVTCPGCRESPLIYPNGEVHLCPAWKNFKSVIAGNIKNRSIIKIWKKDKYFKKFRIFINRKYKKLKGYCSKCTYINKCKGKCTAQRMINYYIDDTHPDFNFPECLYVSPDPMCPLYNNLI